MLCLQALVTSMHACIWRERFPDVELLSAFKLLDPANWPAYGDKNVQSIRDYGVKEGSESLGK